MTLSNITPGRLPATRDHLRDYYSAGGLEVMLGAHEGPVRLPYDADGRQLTAAQYTARLRHWLDAAELFYVTPEMTAVCRTAGTSLPAYRLHVEDLPAAVGLVVWADTVAEVDVAVPPGGVGAMLGAHRQRTEVIGALWGPCMTWNLHGPRRLVPGVHVVTWSNTATLLDPANFAPQSRPLIDRMRADIGALCYHDEVPLPYGEEDRAVGNAALASLMATWLLMGQTITAVDRTPVQRQLRRAYERDGRAAPLVRSVALRRARKPAREVDPATEPAQTRGYSCRWIVSGHWRQQWYPKRQDHRPIYIAETVATPDGCEDAPLKGVERVNVLRR